MPPVGTALLLAVAFPLALTACGAGAGSDDVAATSTVRESVEPIAAGGEGGDGIASFTTEGGVTIEYVLVVPPGREAGVPGRVLIAFPPGGQDLELTQRIVEDRYRAEAVARGWVVASPSAPDTGLWFSDDSAAVLPEVLDEVARQYPPEDGRFDLMGVSNGGLSAFRAALDAPHRFRSLVVFPGYPPSGGDDPRLADLADLGVAMFVGGDDAGWLRPSEATKATLDDLGVVNELTVVDGEGHIIESLTGAQLFDALERVRS
jgi:pimeloyl-ACP methyl ester carboxylesterase